MTFDFPAIGQLIRCRKKIKEAHDVRLVLNSDGLVPSALVRLFAWVAQKVTGRDVQIDRLSILDFNDFGPHAVTLVENGAPADLISAVASIGKCDTGSAARFVKRLMLEKIFVQQHVLNEIETAMDDVVVITDVDLGNAYRKHATVHVETGFVTRVILTSIAIISPFLILLNRIRSYPPRFRMNIKNARSFFIQNVRFEYDGAPGELWRFKRSNASTDYIYDREKCGLFITDQWAPPAEILKGYKAHLNSAGVHFEDHNDFRLSPMTFLWAVKQAATIGSHANMWARNWFYTLLALRLAGCLYREKIHLDNLRTRALLCFDDYSERHIVRTWLARDAGIQTIGMAHSANNGLWASPQLAYVLFDKYLIWNSFSRNLFADHWPEQMLVPYGYDRTDGIIIESPPLPLAPSKKKRVMITLPGLSNYGEDCRKFAGLDSLIKSINSLSQSTLSTLEILIRPKQPNGWGVLLPQFDGERVTPILEDKHSTAEYMRAVDLVVATDGSGVLSECAALNVPVVIFDYFSQPKKIWDRFGSQMYNYTQQDMVSLFQKLAKNEKIDVDFELVWQELSYPFQRDRSKILKDITS